MRFWSSMMEFMRFSMSAWFSDVSCACGFAAKASKSTLDDYWSLRDLRCVFNCSNVQEGFLLDTLGLPEFALMT
ncbi:hypothetical protein Tco_1468291 [Tanacetum coccineum]